MSSNLMLNEKREFLMTEAMSAQEKAYSPYSKFKVGAAILTKDGKVFTGCNVENVSYGVTICAERVAAFKAISEGHSEFESIAVFASSDKPTYPCGACRQVLAEFSPNMQVYVNHDERNYPLIELLPKSFDPRNLSQGNHGPQHNLGPCSQETDTTIPTDRNALLTLIQAQHDQMSALYSHEKGIR